MVFKVLCPREANELVLQTGLNYVCTLELDLQPRDKIHNNIVLTRDVLVTKADIIC